MSATLYAEEGKRLSPLFHVRKATFDFGRYSNQQSPDCSVEMLYRLQCVRCRCMCIIVYTVPAFRRGDRWLLIARQQGLFGGES
jgi:hypothetical protein